MGVNKRLIGAATGGGAFVNDKNFKAITYTGTGSSQAITGVGFKPDKVVIKKRDGSDDWAVLDSTRGANVLSFNNTSSQSSFTFTFDSDGFTVPSTSGMTNGNGNTYVAYCWKANGGTTSSNSNGSITSTVQANTDAGFSIVTYSGDSASSATIGHGLSSAPELIITKALNFGAGWPTQAGGYYGLRINSTGANDTANGNVFYANTAPTSTVYTVGGSDEVNDNYNYVSYCFHSVDGFSKISSYTGNGSATGPVVDTGFEPAFLMIKNVDGSDDWQIFDNARNTSNPRTEAISPSSTGGDYTHSSYQVDFLSNGFQIKGTGSGINTNGDNFIYMAFAANPDEETPTLASSFNIELYTGTGGNRSLAGLGFAPGFIWLKNRDQNAYAPRIFDIVRGATKRLQTSTTAAESTDSTSVTSFDTDGFSLGSDAYVNNSGNDFVAWTFKANDNEPTLFPEAGKKISINHGASNYVALNAVSGSTGKYYFEVKILSHTSVCTAMIGLYSNGYADGWQNTRSRSYYGSNGNRYKGSTSYSYGASYTTGDIIGVAVNGDDDEITFYKNGSSQGLAFSGNEGDSSFGIQLSTGLYAYTADIRFTSSEWTYSAPSGFTQWTAAKTAYDNTDISSSGGGFTYDNNQSIVSANANAGFSIVKYTGTGDAGAKFPHGLSAAPEMIFSKSLDSTNSWNVFHTSLSTNYMLKLNDDAAAFDGSAGTKGGAYTVDASNMTVVAGASNQENNNKSGDDFIAYCFHSITGYQKVGTYTGSTSGVTITTGFKPDFIFIKSSSNVEHWAILDTRRGNFKVIKPNTNDAESDSTLNTFTVTSTGFSFPHQDTADAMLNENGYQYIYMAVAKNVPSNTTLANSFKALQYTGTGVDNLAVTGVGFRSDLIWIKNLSLTRDHNLADTVQGPLREITPNTNEAVENRSVRSFDSDGFTLDNASGNYNENGAGYIAWCWKAGNTWQSNVDGNISSTVNVNTTNGFSIVRYRGAGGSSAQTVGHGLSSAPELIFFKKTSSTQDWYVFSVYANSGTNPANYFLKLNSTDAETENTGSPPSLFAGTAPTSTVFSVGSTLQESADYMAYCWHSVSGYSKIGTYTGNSNNSHSITGLGFQPDFVMIKGTTSGGAGGWYMFDSSRGVQNYVRANLSSAQSTGASSTLTSFDSDGFTLGNDGFLNNNTHTYLYMAFKMN